MMPFELINTIAAVGTFAVISATAIAAVVQLRHMRASNQLEGLLNVLARIEDDDFNTWFTATQERLPALLQDPAFRESAHNGTLDRNAPWVKLANSYEAAGNLMKTHLLPEDPFLDNAAARIIVAWETLEPLTAIVRRRTGPGIWENFEYLYVRSKKFRANHPNGNYPAGEERAPMRDVYLEEDMRRLGASTNGAKTQSAAATLPQE